jgi:phosphoribosylaminoimidazole-succinocarboxamide synthase
MAATADFDARATSKVSGLIEAYTEVARRLGILGENEKVQSGGPRLVQ